MPAQKLGFYRRGLPAEINFPVCLAPMVGLSHCAFRQVVREYLPAGAITLWPSEMLNSRRLPDETLSKIPEAMKIGDENYWVPQILANDEEKIRLSLAKLYAWGAKGIDINMGCPVRKALKHNYGVALMGDVDYAAKVVAATVRHAKGPVSVKLRGVDESEKSQWVDFVKALQGAGADWLCLHPRTAAQKRRGRADWSQFAELHQAVSIPIIANGDVQTVDDVLEILREGHCDMVMVGRALTARPWLVWQVGERLGWPSPAGKSGPAPSTPSEEADEYGRSLFRLLALMSEVFSERLVMSKFNYHVKTSCVWLPFGHHLYARVSKAKNLCEARATLQQFFEFPQNMHQRTDLRQ